MKKDVTPLIHARQPNQYEVLTPEEAGLF